MDNDDPVVMSSDGESTPKSGKQTSADPSSDHTTRTLERASATLQTLEGVSTSTQSTAYNGGEEEEESETSSGNLSPSGVRFKLEKRGRKATTGDFYVKQGHEKQKQMELERRALEEIRDKSVKAKTTKSSQKVKQAAEFADDFKEAPPADIAAYVFESMEEIRKVAEKSKNLKGDLKRVIWVAANTAEGAMLELNKRLNTDDALKEIRNELKCLRTENEKLRIEIDSLRKARDATPKEVAPAIDNSHMAESHSSAMETRGQRASKQASATETRQEENREDEAEEEMTEVEMMVVGNEETMEPVPLPQRRIRTKRKAGDSIEKPRNEKVRVREEERRAEDVRSIPSLHCSSPPSSSPSADSDTGPARAHVRRKGKATIRSL